MKSFIALSVAVLLSLALGCGHRGARTTSPAAPQKPPLPAFLTSIPEDTPYLVVSLEAMPRDYYAKLVAAIGPTMSAELEKKAAGLPDMAAFLAALHKELGGKWNAAGLESLGFSSEPRFALYGLGPVFVARLELRDQQTVAASIRRFMAAWGKTLPPPATRGVATYWRFDSAASTVLVGLAANQLVFAVGKRARIDASLDVILGLQMPPKNLGGGGALLGVMERHRLGPYLAGILDTRRMIDLVIPDSVPITPACATELDALSRLVPRVVFGHSIHTKRQFSGGVIVELAPELIRALRDLRTAVPGLTPLLASKSILAVGGGIDLSGARALAKRTGTAVEGLAAACGSSAIQELAAGIDQIAAAGIPAPFDSISGAALAIQDYARSTDGSQMPARLQGITVLGAGDARQLFAALSASLPWMASLGIEANGGIQEILAGMTPFGIHAGVGDRAIVLAAGDQGRALAEQAISDKPDKDAPFLSMTYDYPKFVALARAVDPDNERNRSTALEDLYATLFARGTATVDVADDGLIMWMTIDLK